MSEERCPVCGKAKEANTYSCSGCGFPLAFVTQFSDKERLRSVVRTGQRGKTEIDQ